MKKERKKHRSCFIVDIDPNYSSNPLSSARNKPIGRIGSE